jgi:hypothetical protein
MHPDHGTWGHRYWLAWAVVVFLTFIAPEVYALVTNWHNTLSASVWDMERFMPGQTVAKWTAWHLLFTGMLLVLFVWLLGHFSFGWWR